MALQGTNKGENQPNRSYEDEKILTNEDLCRLCFFILGDKKILSEGLCQKRPKIFTVSLSKACSCVKSDYFWRI